MTDVRSVSAEAVRALLDGEDQFINPARLLGDLTEAQAFAVAAGSPYTIAQVAAHLHFWQRRQVAWAQGETFAKVEDLDATFSAPSAGEWEQMVMEMLVDMARIKTLARKIGGQPSSVYDNAEAGYGLASSALHNAYHWGQIALLRRMQGLWPPAGDGGDW